MKEIFLKFSNYILTDKDDLRKIRGGYDPSTCTKTCPSKPDATVECEGGCSTNDNCAVCSSEDKKSCCTIA